MGQTLQVQALFSAFWVAEDTVFIRVRSVDSQN